jgi:hypothetical protein
MPSLAAASNALNLRPEATGQNHSLKTMHNLREYFKHAAHVFTASLEREIGEPSVRERLISIAAVQRTAGRQCGASRLNRTHLTTGEQQSDFAEASPIPGLASRWYPRKNPKRGGPKSMDGQRRLHTCRPITTRILAITIGPVKLSLHENRGVGENYGI